jgi:hypothetical protein
MGEKKAAISAAVEPYVTDERLFVRREIMTNQKIRNEFLYFPAETVHDDFLDTLKMLAHVCAPTGGPSVKRTRGQMLGQQTVNHKYGGFR